MAAKNEQKPDPPTPGHTSRQSLALNNYLEEMFTKNKRVEQSDKDRPNRRLLVAVDGRVLKQKMDPVRPGLVKKNRKTVDDNKKKKKVKQNRRAGDRLRSGNRRREISYKANRFLNLRRR